ncbi:alkaline phosphatase, partial [Burkholderia pseudomallei]
MKRVRLAALLGASVFAAAGCGSDEPKTPGASDNGAQTGAARNVIFFLGDGMGMTTLTAARIYALGEDGALTLDTLPETAFVKTYSNDAQVTDSAPSMSAYMTGVKTNNEVISMTPDTKAIEPSASLTGNCGANNGKPVPTLLEIAKAKGLATGVVTTTRVTHATPAATYAHVCHRDAENDIAAQLVPGGAGYNAALGGGVDVVLGGGAQFFVPKEAGGKRADGRHLVNELKAK